MKVKIFSEDAHHIEKQVNNFLSDTEGQIEIFSITQSTAMSEYKFHVQVTVMIQYKEL